MPGAPERIRGYRGGYLPLRRREIEKGLREGAVRAVVSTNALELGIDIGALDVSVMAGYPGTIAATWQRAGRAGRRASRSAAVHGGQQRAARSVHRPEPVVLLRRSPERALIDPDNLHILVDHVKCAAFELPFHGDAKRSAGTTCRRVLGVLAEQGLVHTVRRSDDPATPDAAGTWTSESYPADAVSLRSVSSDNFVIVDTTDEPRVIGETDFTSGPATLHPKAIYIIEGELYQVERLDFEGRKAFVRAIDCDYYTDAITYTRVTILDTFAGRRPCRSHGEVHVVSRVVGFKKIKFYTNENVGLGRARPARAADAHDVVLADVPAAVMDVPAVRARRSARRRRRPVVRDAAGRAAAADVRSARHRHLDRHCGAAEPADLHLRQLSRAASGSASRCSACTRSCSASTRRLIAECACENGCPGCVGPVGNTGPLAKTAALRILDRLIERLSLDPAAAEPPSARGDSRVNISDRVRAV